MAGVDEHQYSPGQYTRTFIEHEDIIPLMDLSFLQEDNEEIKESVDMDHMGYLQRHITPRECEKKGEEEEQNQESPEENKDTKN